MTVYLNQIYQNLPRFLGSVDLDPISKTYGVTDRQYTSWKTIDFANATNQGVVHGLALLIKNKMLPENISEKYALNVINALFDGTENIMRRNGSLEESFPFEGSYCVTALIAFDLLSAIETLDLKDKNHTVQALISFLNKQEETHAFISNHLATAAAAYIKWGKHIDDAKYCQKGQKILDRILEKQSENGWYLEYEGADPGYQTLCLYYLTEIYRISPSDELQNSIRKAIGYLTNFVYPDGSFAGIIGSRNTRIFIPAAFEFFADTLKDAKSISHFMKKSINDNKTITLSAIDMPNFGPYFNSYCRACIYEKNNTKKTKNLSMLPHMSDEQSVKYIEDAGQVILNNKNSYTVISTHKGGVCASFPKNGGQPVLDTGPVIKNKKAYYGIQGFKQNKVNLQETEISILSEYSKITDNLPSPFSFLILRLFSLSIFQSLWLGRLFKKHIVKMLMTNEKSLGVKNKRIIKFDKIIEIYDTQEGHIENLEIIHPSKPVKQIHMASSGYWQAQDST